MNRETAPEQFTDYRTIGQEFLNEIGLGHAILYRLTGSRNGVVEIFFDHQAGNGRGIQGTPGSVFDVHSDGNGRIVLGRKRKKH